MSPAPRQVRRRCRTSIRAPPAAKLGPRHSLKFRDNLSTGGRSPRLARRVGSLTTEDVISFTVSSYDHLDTDPGHPDRAGLRRQEFRPRAEAEEEEARRGKEAENLHKGEEGEVDREEDRFRRETRKSTKSNKSLTLPMDPLKRKDSSSSSCDLSKVWVKTTFVPRCG